MVGHQFLGLSIGVRVPVSQHKRLSYINSNDNKTVYITEGLASYALYNL